MIGIHNNTIPVKIIESVVVVINASLIKSKINVDILYIKSDMIELKPNMNPYCLFFKSPIVVDNK